MARLVVVQPSFILSLGFSSHILAFPHFVLASPLSFHFIFALGSGLKCDSVVLFMFLKFLVRFFSCRFSSVMI